jgi:predicted MPP superfamily phosphohydrolase
VFTIISSLATLVALYFTYKQSKISEITIKETIKSINQDTINRQLTFLSKIHYIINVQNTLEKWLKELKKIKKDVENSISLKNGDILKKISEQHIKAPNELGIEKSVFEKMPEWLGQIQMSGCQYYYNTMCVLDHLYKNDTAKFDYAQKLLPRICESIYSIEKLLSYISDMIPEVILTTPASISDFKFFRK